MKKNEAKWQTILNQYFREKKIYCFYELKYTQSETFSFAKIETVQFEGLPAAEKNGLVWKWSDEESRPKPCDGVSIPPLPAYLVIKFPDGFYLIKFSRIVAMREDGFISITRDQAERVAEKIIRIENKKSKNNYDDFYNDHSN